MADRVTFTLDGKSVSADPGETHNVASAHPDVVERLEREITRIVRSGRSTAGPEAANDGGATWWPQITWYTADE